MKTTTQTNTPPDWQSQRQKVLQHHFRLIKAAVGRGRKVTNLLYRTAKKLDGQPVAPGSVHRFYLSFSTIRRFYSRWQRGGELPSALGLNFKRGPVVSITAPVLIRFAQYVASHDCTSLKAAWRKFIALPGSRAKGVKVSYASLTRFFPVAQFRALQAFRKTIAQAEDYLTRLQFTIAANLHNQLPDRLAPRPRGHCRGSQGEI